MASLRHPGAKLEAFAAGLGAPLTIQTIDPALLQRLPANEIHTRATYARLLIPKFFADDCERVLYLDADCVVVGDLSPLWSFDISDCLIGGVHDPGAFKDERLARRSGDPRACDVDVPDYVNGGVLLINLREWRETKFSESVFDYLKSRPILRFLDQSAVNAVATGRINQLPDIWNVMPFNDRPIPADARIVHFTSKPWKNPRSPLARIYLHHRSRTPFPLQIPSREITGLSRHKSRRFLNLLLLRPKYWRRLIYPRLNERRFTDAYLRSLSAQPA